MRPCLRWRNFQSKDEFVHAGQDLAPRVAAGGHERGPCLPWTHLLPSDRTLSIEVSEDLECFLLITFAPIPSICEIPAALQPTSQQRYHQSQLNYCQTRKPPVFTSACSSLAAGRPKCAFQKKLAVHDLTKVIKDISKLCAVWRQTQPRAVDCRQKSKSNSAQLEGGCWWKCQF